MKTFYCFFNQLSKKESLNQNINLSSDESNHLINVLRANYNDQIILIGQKDFFYKGHLIAINNNLATIKIHSIEIIKKSYPEISLVVAVPKRRKMHFIIQKATEIGVQNIIPIQTERTEVFLKEKNQNLKLIKWNKIAIEACKQSKNISLPNISEIKYFKDYIKDLCILTEHEFRLIGSLELNALNLKNVLNTLKFKKSNKITLLIGPEGDFTNEEYEQARLNNFISVNLTKNILKVDTAVLYSLSVLNYQIKN